MSAAYQPIPCIQHEQLEFSVLRRLRMHIEYRDGATVRSEAVLPVDVYTRDGAEWMRFRREGGEEAVIRLDDIVKFSELT